MPTKAQVQAAQAGVVSEPDRFSITFGSFIKSKDVKYGLFNRKTMEQSTEVFFATIRDRTKDTKRVNRGGDWYNKPQPHTIYGDSPSDVRGKVEEYLAGVPERDRRARINLLVGKSYRTAGTESSFDVAEKDLL